MNEGTYLGRNISVAYRLGNRFYAHILAPYQVGYGQQFFLLRIHENQGISMYDLARMGAFDKGTVTRAVQRLEEQGYVRSEPDERDKRVRRLYTTQSVADIVAVLYEAREKWNDTLTKGMTPEEAQMARELLVRIAKNALDLSLQEEREG